MANDIWVTVNFGGLRRVRFVEFKRKRVVTSLKGVKIKFDEIVSWHIGEPASQIKPNYMYILPASR